MPQVQLSLYGVITSPGANYMAQWAGLGSIVVALIAWFTRKFDDQKVQHNIVLILLIYFIFGLYISVLGITSGIMNATGWFLASICLFFVISYAYFYLRRHRQVGRHNTPSG
jgi:hypothetical protein